MTVEIKSQTRLEKYAGQRKHGSQLHRVEERKLFTRLEGIKKWRLSFHADERIIEKGINATMDDITSTVFNSSIIEYRIVHNDLYDTYDERVILRSKAIVNEEYNLNVVFSLTNRKIVTVWMNHLEDLHDTLDWSIYNENMAVLGA